MSRVIVKNLPSTGVTEEQIKKHFEDIDNVTDIKIKYNEVGASRRFAFIGFKSKAGAEKAIEKLANTYIKNSKLLIEPCKAIKDLKPEKLSIKRNKKNRDDSNNTLESDNTDKKSKNSRKENEEVFNNCLEEPEFREFVELQRNLGDKNKVKQVWADDFTANDGLPIQSDKSGDDLVDDKDNSENEEDSKPKKKHKRGKRKKKSEKAKTKPKELFVHTLKASGFPDTVRRKDIKDFFKPTELLSVRINKRDGICYASFKDDKDLKFALRKNLHFWKTSRIKLLRHNVTRSRIYKETAKEKVKEREEHFKKYDESLAETEPIEESGRLFIRNLNYTCKHEDLEEVFSKYGDITEIHYPIDKQTSMPKGFAYVEFMFPQSAVKAYEELNGTIFQGRNFHIIPSKPKPEPKFTPLSCGTFPNYPADQMNPHAINRSTFKREQEIKQREESSKGSNKSNWNILFLGQNALADVVSNMKSVDKSKLLTEHSNKEPIAVRMALGDATVVDQMRKFLISNGVELDSFDNPQAPRSKTVIIVKNLPASTSKADLQDMFGRHGKVAQIILPPNGLTAIVEMEEVVEAKIAFKKLAYSKFRDTVLYLEWAPINVFREKSLEDQEQQDHNQMKEAQTGTKILVKNIPFEATVQELRKIFAAFGEINFVRIPKKVDGQHRGFGFVDFLLKEDALRAFQCLCHSTHLYGRKLVLEWAKQSEVSEDK